LKNNKILISFWQEKMIRGKYEVYSGRPHLSADRQACLPLPAGRRGQAGMNGPKIFDFDIKRVAQLFHR